jgi:hypothetical protein
MCAQINLAWKSTAATGTRFRIYQAWTGEGGTTCRQMQAGAGVVLTTAPNARSGRLYNQIATGGGAQCLWITAVNSLGESPQVAAVSR